MLRALAGLRAEGGFSQTKPLLLLCYLALEGPQVRRHLAELFWRGASNPLGSLSVAINQLKRGLPGSIGTDGDKVLAHVATDVQAFLAAVDAGDVRTARSLYVGSFLDGVHLQNCSVELEEWVFETRETVGERFRDCLTDEAEAATARGSLGEAAELAREAWQLKGSRPPEAGSMKRLHVLFRTSGLSELARGVRHEAEALGMDLPGDTAAQPRPDASRTIDARPSTPVPVPDRKLVAREPELAQLADLLERADGRVITLAGPGGVGKTRLAQQVGFEQSKHGQFQGKVFFAGLASVTTPDMLAASIARAVGTPISGRRRPVEELAEHIADSRLLLILDNFEQLLTQPASVAQLRELLDWCPGLKLLVTSRERLHVSGEWVIPLEGLPLPSPEEERGKDAESYGAVRLFVESAKRATPGFALDDHLVQAVVEVCRLVDGLPLAVQLAASWTRILPVTRILAELTSNRDFLVNPVRDVDERHRSMRSVFEHSWKLLRPEEQMLLKRLTLFEDGFRKEAASEVAGASYEMLASLVDKSLLRVSADGRFGQHLLTKGYAARMLTADEDSWIDAGMRHCRYYLGLLDPARRQASGERRSLVLSLLDEEFYNVRAAWQWALLNGAFELVRPAAGVLGSYFEIRGRLQEGIDHFADSAERLGGDGDGNRGALGNVLIELGWLCYLAGRYSAALEYARRGLSLLEPLNDERGVAVGLETLGLASWRTGSYSEARRHLHDGLAMARSAGDDLRTAYLLSSLSAVEMGAGNYRQTAQFVAESVTIQEELGEETVAIYNLHNLARLRLLQGDPVAAAQLFRQAHDRAGNLGFRQLIPHLLLGIARAEFACGEYVEAQASCHQALAVTQHSNQPLARAEALILLAGIATAEGRYAKAREYGLQSLRLCRRIEETPALLNALLVLAELEAAEGRVESAFELSSLVAEHPLAERPVTEGAGRLRDFVLLTHPLASVPLVDPEQLDQGIRQAVDSLLSDSLTTIIYPQPTQLQRLA